MVEKLVKIKISKYVYKAIDCNGVVYDNILVMSEFCNKFKLNFHQLNGNFRNKNILLTRHKDWLIERKLK
jgi:hypothetical protein